VKLRVAGLKLQVELNAQFARSNLKVKWKKHPKIVRKSFNFITHVEEFS